MPLYLEPLVDSGERVCIGVLATDGQAVEVAPALQLGQLDALYGGASRALTWAAELALKEVLSLAQQHGIPSIAERKPSIDGLSFGGIRQEAGRNLLDLARVALTQVSAFAAMEGATLPEEEADFALAAYAAAEPAGSGNIVRSVRTSVGATQPDLRRYFWRSFAPKQSARPLVYGFVGKRVAANFSALDARSPNGLSGQVDRAKARVLDLETLRRGKFTDELPLPRRRLKYELFVLIPARPRRGEGACMLREAEQSLEVQADEAKVQWRHFGNTQEMARTLMAREPA